MPSTDTGNLLAGVTAEIEALHALFEDWFAGRDDRDDAWFDREITERFSPDMLLVYPGGARVARDALTAAVKNAHGCSPDFRIQIRNVTLRPVQSERYVLAIYEEWQRNAANSKPPDNGRTSSVVFEIRARDPLRLRWLHIHETWLPADVIAKDDFAF
ncbi:MAG: DUF4440 domain-containing protein [Methyloligellaceae bacterium]